MSLFLQILLVSGGWGNGSYLDSTEIFDPSLRSWRAGAALPSPRDSLSAINIDKRVLLFGNDILLIFYIGDVKASRKPHNHNACRWF